MTLRPNRQRWLLALEVPLRGPDSTRYSGDQLLSKGSCRQSNSRYSASAYPDPDRPVGLAGGTFARSWRSRARKSSLHSATKLQRTYQNLPHESQPWWDAFLGCLIYTLNPTLAGRESDRQFCSGTKRVLWTFRLGIRIRRARHGVPAES